MSLVAYGSSDDENDSELENSTASIFNPDSEVCGGKLFTLLPAPKRISEVVPLTAEEDVLSVNVDMKKKPTIKISIPSLRDFKDDEDVEKIKKIKLIPKGSGLLGMLPKPQNITLKESQKRLTPHVLNKTRTAPALQGKPVVTTTKKPTTKTMQIIPRTVVTRKPIQPLKHDSDDDDDEVTDFFSLDQKDELPVYPKLPEIIPLSNILISKDIITPSGSSKTFEKQNDAITPMDMTEFDTEENINATLVIPEGPELFADEGFKRLTGKKKNVIEEINFIEINAADQLPNKDEWLKSISEEKSHNSHKKSGMPSAQSRRKHQITYLAYQAKERELELKNQWAMNRMTRQQTQAKYGF